ncbi:MAG TPA: glycosyltransferase family 25 protein [Pirellulales bacterium]|jgi:hypothetical protein|nr:glycosyltransferase family 25 protein [Pirellulales bacterium]
MLERCYCINLDRRKDRYEQFLQTLPLDWPFPQPVRFRAIDGAKLEPPDWFGATGGRAGAWGCYLSHLRILEELIHEGANTGLILEDDVTFCPDFTNKVQEFFSALPSNWEMAYLGGQLLFTGKRPPKILNSNVVRAYNINRTHAYAINGRKFFKRMYKHLTDWSNWSNGHHVDHHLGKLHGQDESVVCCPRQWLAGQGAGYSNIAGREFEQDRFWVAPIVASGGKSALNKFWVGSAPQIKGPAFVAVMGLHSSGSSALAGMLHHLDIHMGNRLGGYYGSNPDKSCGFEADGLARLCEKAIPFPSCMPAQSDEQIVDSLRKWIAPRCKEALRKKTLAGGKYPMLCRMGTHLQSVLGDLLRVISIERPIEESIESLQKREPKRNADELADHQRWLAAGRDEFLESFPKQWQLTVTYDDLIHSPGEVARNICQWLGYTPESYDAAINYIQADRRHINHAAALTPTG